MGYGTVNRNNYAVDSQLTPTMHPNLNRPFQKRIVLQLVYQMMEEIPAFETSSFWNCKGNGLCPNNDISEISNLHKKRYVIRENNFYNNLLL